MFSRFRRTPRPAAGADWRWDGFLQDAIQKKEARRPAPEFPGYEFGPTQEEVEDWRWRYSLEEAASALRRPEEERARAHVDREEAAVGKRGHISPDVVSKKAGGKAWTQEELAASLKEYQTSHQQIKSKNLAFALGGLVGWAMGLVGGVLATFYILMMLGKIKL